MSRMCDICARGSNRANSRSHSNIASKRQQFANLQTRRVDGLKLRVCTRCIKAANRVTA